MAVCVPESLIKLQNLEHLSEFFHHCINTLSLSEENTNIDKGPNISNKWSPQELKITYKNIQKLFRQAATNENFLLPNDLPENVKCAFKNVYRIRHKDILSVLVNENLVNNGHNLVENIDWKLKWILGSSQLATIREPVCQVELRCASIENDMRTLKVEFEANLEMIDNLIFLLSNVRNELGVE